MRLWSLHPRYLDRQGLVAVWREALLAQAVLRGQTRGYRNHPQLARFRAAPDPLAAVAAYLLPVHEEARERGYSFEQRKIGPTGPGITIPVTSGQIEYEWAHLMAKLLARSPATHGRWSAVVAPDPHPLFRVRSGGIEPWERRSTP